MKAIRLLSFALLACFLLSSSACKNSKDSISKNKTEPSEELAFLTKASPELRSLILDLDKTNSWDQPSEDLIAKYGISSTKGAHYIGGIAKTTEEASEEKMKEKGVIIGTKAGNIWTVSIPLNSLKAVLEMSDITYLESKKVNLKTN